MSIHNDADKLREIKTLKELISFVRSDLDWPIPDDADEDDVTYDYDAAELGIEPKNAVKIKEIKQLKPLASGQSWGIFWVNFEKKRLPVVVLRRILSALVIKKRVNASKAKQASWHSNDLLFISSYGEETHRELAIAHFSENPETNNLPTLRVLQWDDEDAPLKLEETLATLKQKLRWDSKFTSNPQLWKTRWTSAFQKQYRQNIKTASELADVLALLAMRIRKRMRTLLRYEDGFGPIRKILRAFQQTLIADLDDDGFSDMYAQTIAYGLLTARIRRPAGSVAEDLVHMVPESTNPFLKDMLSVFLKIGGRKGKIDFDELGIQEVVDVLHEADMEAVLRDFNNKNPDEDPVIHFYEHFLAAYDKKQKIERGVFYTPRPVVSYIVRSVHEMLQMEFGLEDGLASTVTWQEFVQSHPDVKIPEGTKSDEYFVQVLDPATGTATFLVEAIDVIHKHLVQKWEKSGKKPAEIEVLWNEYVPKALLPRLYGFELLMAPYAIAHMKLMLKLTETGYKFKDESARANIYLTNTLEPKVTQLPQIGYENLAKEAAAVNEIKWYKRFTVVIGNPPYSPSISEPEWLIKLLEDWKKGLNETKSDLNREEWKFLRFAQYICKTSGVGIVGFIINRDFLDGIAKRKMRENIAETFPLRIAVDLNGDVKGNISDENVFAIEQGVAITLLCTDHAKPKLRFTSRVGTRAQKYLDLIARTPIDVALADIEAASPYFRWIPYTSKHTADAFAEYSEWFQIKSAFAVASSGIQTKRDALCVAFTRSEIWNRIRRFEALSVESARTEFDLGSDGRDWSVIGAKADIAASGSNQSYLCPILYRPFDIRFTYWTGKTKGFIAYPRREVMQNVIGHKNIGIIFNRQIVGDSISHFSVARTPICHGTFYLGNKGQDYFAPLMVFDDDLLENTKSGRSNFTPLFLNALRKAISAKSAELVPEDIFHYIYAVFHSPIYRTRYGEFLKIDFPRLPLTENLDLFHALADLGSELVAMHLLESPKLAQSITKVIGSLTTSIEKISWSNDTVWIDKKKTVGFEGVPENVWNFHIGGYQVCEKWLKDRKGRVLLADDIAHYHKIVVALSETIHLMAEIDIVINQHGGWPGAFQTTPTTP